MAGPGYLFGRFSLLEARVIAFPVAIGPGRPATFPSALTPPSTTAYEKGPGIRCRALVLR
jgi:hypothetical protein